MTKQSHILSPPTVKLLVGGPNSGKSTWIKEVLNPMCELTESPWPTVISFNRVRKAYAQEHGIPYGETFSPLHKEAVEAKFFNALDIELEQGKDVVINHRNGTASERAAILRHIHEVNPDYYTEALYFPIDTAEALRRNAKRNAQLQAEGKAERHFDDEAMLNCLKRIEPPNEKEGFDKVRNAMQCPLPEDRTVHRVSTRGCFIG